MEKNRLEEFARHLAPVTQLFHSMNINLSVARERRVSDKFDPENAREMINIYPRDLVGMVTPDSSVSANGYLVSLRNLIVDANPHSDSYSKGLVSPMVEVIVEGVEQDDTVAAIDFMEDVRKFKKLGGSYSHSLVLVVDELYIKTVLDKIKIGTIENPEEKLARDIVPSIVEYIRKAPDLMRKLGCFVKEHPIYPKLARLFSPDQYSRTPDFTAISRDIRGYGGKDVAEKLQLNRTTEENKRTIQLAFVSLIVFELINEMVKGETKNFRNFDMLFNYLMTIGTSEKRSHKYIEIETVLLSIIGKGREGSFFNNMVKSLMDCITPNLEKRASFREMREMVCTIDYSCDELVGEDGKSSVDRKQLISSVKVLKFAESLMDIYSLMRYSPYDIKYYAEAFFGTQEDIDKEMSKVIEMTRQAALAEVDMQYTTTKYSKKDAIDNAHHVIQECRALKRKLRCKEAIEKIGIVEAELLKKVAEYKKYDHKKDRMTINIAYPEGYKG